MGMRMAWKAPFDPQYAYMALNMLPRVRGKPSPYLTVPYPTRIVLAGSSLVPQALAVLQVAAPVNVQVLSGELYTEVAGVLARQVTTANLTTAAITLAATGRVFVTPFNGLLVFSDGVNTAFTWDGTAGAGGLVKLTNAPVFYGKPTVYYGKLMGIKNTERDTFVWSEENAANTGYEAGGFNNAWSLTQTGGGALYALLGANEGLYYWRSNHTGIIRGAVTPDFSSAGVHDDVSTSVGVTDPEAVCFAGERVWFGDPQGRPYTIVDGQVIPVWGEVADAFGLGAGDATPVAGVEPTTREVVAVPNEGLVVFHWPFLGFVVFDATRGTPLMLWVPPGGVATATSTSPDSAARLGPQWTGGKLQIGIAYGAPNPDVWVDHWPPYDVSNLYPAWAYAVDSDAAGVLVVGPLGGDVNVVTDWTDATVDTYTPRTDGIDVPLGLLANAAEVFEPPAGGFGTPPSLTAVSVKQTLHPNNQRRNTRLPWGMRRELRQLWLAVYGSLGASQGQPWGVASITARGVPFGASPSKT